VIRPGEIYWADLLQGGRRPVLVISRESLNRGSYVVIIALTTGRLTQRRSQPNCVFFRAGEFGLSADCVAQCETIASIAIAQLDISAGPIGHLDALSLRNVIQATGYVIESDCEPA
jgi:mRNA-degrading endonuclease toxin of MazEF toxin-antitoxin module